MEKKCNICKILKSEEEFNRSSQHKSGRRNYCKNCQKGMSQKYKERLGEELKERKREWVKTNHDKVRASRKKTYEKNGKRISKEKYRKIKSDPVKYLKILMRRRIRAILSSKNFKKRLSSESIVGCSYQKLKIYLETKFTDGMSWDNQGTWHIDHIIPLSSAQNEEQVFELCHYTNLQPLWATENLKKGNKIK